MKLMAEIKRFRKNNSLKKKKSTRSSLTVTRLTLLPSLIISQAQLPLPFPLPHTGAAAAAPLTLPLVNL